MCWVGISSTAHHQGLSKYLTAQDTLVTPTLTEYNTPLDNLRQSCHQCGKRPEFGRFLGSTWYACIRNSSFISLWMFWLGSFLEALKKHMEGNDNHHNAQTQALYLYICIIMMPTTQSNSTCVLCMVWELCEPVCFFSSLWAVVPLMDKHKPLWVKRPSDDSSRRRIPVQFWGSCIHLNTFFLN